MKINTSLIGVFVTSTLTVFFAGCTPIIPPPAAAPQSNEVKKAKQTHPKMWKDQSTLESHYNLKPEPYSLESGQKDPELLGPQSTLKKELEDQTALESASNQSESLPAGEGTGANIRETAHPPMDRNRCISLIGQAKFDEYTKRFGSETAAIRKCIILERVQKSNE